MLSKQRPSLDTSLGNITAGFLGHSNTNLLDPKDND